MTMLPLFVSPAGRSDRAPRLAPPCRAGGGATGGAEGRGRAVSARWLSLFTLVLLAGYLSVAERLYAQEDAPSADDVARELSNPVGSLASLVFQGTYAQWDGSAPGVSDQNTSSLVFLPTLPFKVGSGNLIVRPSFPFSAAPVPDGDGGWTKERGFGDMNIVANWGRAEESGLLWSIGLTSALPTASNEALGNDQWQLGPAAILGILKPWGVLGAFWQHWFGLNPADGEEAVNLGTLQLFYWFSLGGGWQVGGSPTPSANYVTAQDIDFSVPINLGLAKTFVLGSTPLKTTLQGQYFATRPDVVGPSWGIFFQVTPVVRVPW